MSTRYYPNLWIVVRFTFLGKEPFERILGTWSGGGFTGYDWWRFSSKIVSVEETEDVYIFTNFTGSVYTCRKKDYGMGTHTAFALSSNQKNFEAEGGKIEIVESYNPQKVEII